MISTVNCRFCHWFAFVFITFPSPDCQKGIDFFVFIDNCGGQLFNLLNNSGPLPLLGIDLCTWPIKQRKIVLESFVFIFFTWECDAQIN